MGLLERLRLSAYDRVTVIGGKVRISSRLREVSRLEAEYMSVLPPLYQNDEREKRRFIRSVKALGLSHALTPWERLYMSRFN